MFKNLSPELLGLSGRQSEIIEPALSFGFRGLDLELPELVEQVKSHGLAHARRLLDSAKLQVGGFRLPVRWQDDDATFRADMATLPAMAEVAAQAGWRRALVAVQPGSDERHFHQNFEFHRQRLNDLAQALEPHGIRLGVGFSAASDLRQSKSFEFIHTFDALSLLLSTMAARNVGLIVDLWDLHVSGGTIAALRKGPVERIVAVRVADAPADVPAAECSSRQRLLPGETGVVDIAAALVALAEMGYDGPVTPAPHPERLRGLGRDAAVRQVGQSLDTVWKAAGLNALGKLSPAARR